MAVIKSLCTHPINGDQIEFDLIHGSDEVPLHTPDQWRPD